MIKHSLTDKIKIKIKNIDNFCIISLIIIVVLIRIPHLILLQTANDPGRDGASYYSLAKNLATHKGYVLDFKELFNSYLDTNEKYKHEITYTCTWFPPVYPVISACFMKVFGIKIFSLLLVNLFLHLLSVIILYRIFRKYLDEFYSIVLCGLFSLTPLIFSLSVSILSETSYLFFVLVTIYYCIQYDFNHFNRKAFFKLLIASSLTLLTRNIAIFVIAGVFVWLLSLRQFKRSFIFLLITGIVFLLWEVGFSYVSHHHITSRYITTWTQSIAFLGDIEMLHSNIISMLKKAFSVKSISGIFQLVYKMPSSSFLVLYPVFLFFLIAKKERTNIQNLLLINIAIIILTSIILRPLTERYFIVLIPLMLISGATLLNNQKFPLPEWNNDRFLLIILGFLLTSFSYAAFKSLKDATADLSYSKNVESQYLESGITDHDSKCMASNPMIVNHLLGIETLILPVNAKSPAQLESVIDQYRIDYLIITTKDSEMINSDLYKHFYLKEEFILLDSFKFVLEKNFKDVWVYSITCVCSANALNNKCFLSFDLD